MMCVERVRQYAFLPQEAPPYKARRSPAGWPQEGRVELRNVSVSYPGGPNVIHDINVNIEPSEKVTGIGSCCEAGV